MKKKKNVIIIFSLLITIVCIIFLKIQYKDPDFYYTQEYLIGENNIQGQVDINYFYDKNIDFAIGANKEGQAVFKNPSKAFKILKKDYKQGLKKIQKEFNLFPINQFNFESYGKYGWQVTTNSEIEKEQVDFITAFIDIYANSFK